jgi:hypothetical protein
MGRPSRASHPTVQAVEDYRSPESYAAAAKRTHVGESTFVRCMRVKTKGTAALWAAVKRGDLTVAAAFGLLHEPPSARMRWQTIQFCCAQWGGHGSIDIRIERKVAPSRGAFRRLRRSPLVR